MNDLLKEIIAHKRTEVAAAKGVAGLEVLKEKAAAQGQPRDFYQALTAKQVRIIAECKKQSPSRGVMKPDYDPVMLATSYEQGGAAAISVLTDNRYFGGSLSDLTKVRAQVSVPVLRKDFIVDEYQIYEARAAGADTFLLIAGTIPYEELFRLTVLGQSLGMEPLIESHTAEELSQACEGPGKIFGINNRNLSTFKVDLTNAANLIAAATAKRRDLIMVCESGIKTPADISAMKKSGYHVFLVGEALVAHKDPKSAVSALIAAI
jgi:indole-3-glycerol phosphate synthase